MRELTIVIRLLFGSLFIITGLNGFFHFLPNPVMIGKEQEFVLGLMASGYFFPLLMGTQVICGVLLVTGAFVPLAIVALAPIVVNIFLFHLFVSPKGLPIAIIVCAFEIYLAFFAEPYNKIVMQIFRCPMRERALKRKSR
jgi:putative oxidoreductase